MTDIEKLEKIPPKEARDIFTGNEEISIRMIDEKEELNKDKKNEKRNINGKKRKFDVSIASKDAQKMDYIIAKAEDNEVYKLEDGTLTHINPSKEKELR